MVICIGERECVMTHLLEQHNQSFGPGMWDLSTIHWGLHTKPTDHEHDKWWPWSPPPWQRQARRLRNR